MIINLDNKLKSLDNNCLKCKNIFSNDGKNFICKLHNVRIGTDIDIVYSYCYYFDNMFKVVE